MDLARKYTAFVKAQAQRLGFSYCGVARAQPLDQDARRLEAWLHQGRHGSMGYMENYFDLRIDPTRLVPGARSVITLMLNYYPEQEQQEEAPKIAKYAYGKDYHEVIRAKLNELLALMRREIGEVQGRGFVDSAPVLERAWAQRSGLGWIGRNGNLIHKEAGSFFFLATLITDVALDYDDPYAKDYCGTCRKCIDACPTDAILEDKVIDGSRCISYFTIELKNQLIPENMEGKWDDWLFGCDTCQDVCPWNRFSRATTETEFTAIPELLNFTTGQWEELTEEAFKTIFRHSPLKRSKYAGIQRNLRFLNHQTGQ
ncbi:MAG: tRNA epoxyqueuosine(34) reductase QueG [Candidatus Pseudobacter hemicellulosilyticus]|uniref:Epoxyqueuosine reductase n=1 Tax=Candidatus Pseudobacter hemicellulosilyticus TaxID=3121375 RepID=A0AAJ5WY87_9BACT|nr:MAG: tRNA epoxyqueuosine(34) reductase QueG [Pseudobacter sp.]